MFLAHTIIMTLALVLAARKQDPNDYNEGVDKFRGMCEVLLFLCVMYNVCKEVYKLNRYIHAYIRMLTATII